MSQTFVIIGAGHAAGQLAASLRTEGFDGRILVIGEEPYIPYQRPPLSKKYLAGELALERVYFKPQMFYDKQNVEFMLNTRVSAIDPKDKTVTLESGESINYDKLALTTGSRVRRLQNLPGVDLENIFYLRTIEDVDAIQSCFKQGGKCIIVGGGYIGLEVAAVAVKHGIQTTVLEMDERVMSRVVAPEMSEFYTRVHTEEGVDIRTGVRVTGFEGDGKISAAVCSDGQRFEADFVVIGVGIIPNSELAEAAGLEVDNGIVVNECAQTSDPDIVAAGDCTNHPNGILGRRIRLESVQNALDQAKVAAAAMCGKPREYKEVPWFWSDQYDLKLQIAGLSQGYNRLVVRGDMSQRAFAAFYLKGNELLAVDAVNSARDFMVTKKLLIDKPNFDVEKLANVDISLQEAVI